MGTPLARACEDLALLGCKTSSINPRPSQTLFNPLAQSSWVNSSERFLEVRNTGLGEFTEAAWSVILERYSQREVTGHTSTSSGREE